MQIDGEGGFKWFWMVKVGRKRVSLKITTVTEKSCSGRLLLSTSTRLISDSGAFTLSERKPNIIKEMYF